MELDYEGSNQELKETKVGDILKPVDVMYLLEQIKTMVITPTDRKFAESYGYIYKKVQEMSISERMQTSTERYSILYECLLYLYWRNWLDESC